MNRFPEAASEDVDGVPLSLHALFNGKKDIAVLLAEYKTKLSLHEAAAFGKCESIQSSVEPVDSFSADGFTPLSLAAAFGGPEAVTALLGRGADIELSTSNPNITVRPLHAAAFGRNPQTVKVLLESGADVNAAQPGGFTALHTAAQNGDVEIVRILLEFGADRNAVTHEGKTAGQLSGSELVSELLS